MIKIVPILKDFRILPLKCQLKSENWKNENSTCIHTYLLLSTKNTSILYVEVNKLNKHIKYLSLPLFPFKGRKALLVKGKERFTDLTDQS